MLFRLSEIKEINSVLGEFVSNSLPIKAAWRINKFLDQSLKAEEKLEEFRISLVKKYGKEISDGKWEVPEENIENFSSEFIQLLNEEVEIEFSKVPISMLENLEISLIQIQKISKLLEDQ